MNKEKIIKYIESGIFLYGIYSALNIASVSKSAFILTFLKTKYLSK
jgi:hypothetical protein